MPPKKLKSKVGAKTSVKTQQKVCDLCHDLLEDSHKALVCKGGCNSSVHRYCAGVTHYHYEKLTVGAEPFVCLFCSLKSHRALVLQLQSEVEGLKTELVSTKITLQERTVNPVAVSTEPRKLPPLTPLPRLEVELRMYGVVECPPANNYAQHESQGKDHC